MAITPINLKPKQSGGGGGLWGSIGTIAGGVAGAVASPFVGPEAIPAGMAAGGAIGGTVGSIADPAKVSGGNGPNPLATAARLDPEAMMAGLADGHNALMNDMTIPAPEKEKLSASYFQPAMEQLKKYTGGR